MENITTPLHTGEGQSQQQAGYQAGNAGTEATHLDAIVVKDTLERLASDFERNANISEDKGGHDTWVQGAVEGMRICAAMVRAEIESLSSFTPPSLFPPDGQPDASAGARYQVAEPWGVTWIDKEGEHAVGFEHRRHACNFVASLLEYDSVTAVRFLAREKAQPPDNVPDHLQNPAKKTMNEGAKIK